jgi:hypothetical protein
MLGEPVSVSLPADDGSLVTVPTMSGGSYVLDFWAPACEPCRTSTPALVARKAEHQARGASLVLVGVLDQDEDTEQARAVLESWGGCVNGSWWIDMKRPSRSSG